MGASLSGETLIPGSIPFPITADGDSLDKGRAAQSWAYRLRQLSATAGTHAMNPPSSLADLTKASSHLIATCEEDIAEMVRAVGPGVFNSYDDAHQVKSWSGGVKYFSQIDERCRILYRGAPTDVFSKDTDPTEFEYGTRQSTYHHDKLIWENARVDVKMGRAIPLEASCARAIKRLRISPLRGSFLSTRNQMNVTTSLISRRPRVWS